MPRLRPNAFHSVLSPLIPTVSRSPHPPQLVGRAELLISPTSSDNARSARQGLALVVTGYTPGSGVATDLGLGLVRFPVVEGSGVYLQLQGCLSLEQPQVEASLAEVRQLSKRLSQHLEHVSAELWQFVKEEDAICARLISPGRGSEPPPMTAIALAVRCGVRNVPVASSGCPSGSNPAAL